MTPFYSATNKYLIIYMNIIIKEFFNKLNTHTLHLRSNLQTSTAQCAESHTEAWRQAAEAAKSPGPQTLMALSYFLWRETQCFIKTSLFLINTKDKTSYGRKAPLKPASQIIMTSLQCCKAMKSRTVITFKWSSQQAGRLQSVRWMCILCVFN